MICGAHGCGRLAIKKQLRWRSRSQQAKNKNLPIKVIKAPWTGEWFCEHHHELVKNNLIKNNYEVKDVNRLCLRQHGMLDKVSLPKADILVIAGDYCPNFTRTSTLVDAEYQLNWLKTNFIPFIRTLDYSNIVIVAGNHDWVHENPATKNEAREILPRHYLQDQETVISGLRFYGSPWQPWFYDWAFNFPERDRGKKLGLLGRIYLTIPIY